MSDEMSASCTRATALAAVIAVMDHLHLGEFLSEFVIHDPYVVRGSPWGISVSECRIEGRTNTGSRVNTYNSLVFHPDSSWNKKIFPIEKVVVTLCKGMSYGSDDERYEYTFGLGVKNIKKLDRPQVA